VNGETAEQWQYDERGWLTDISHISEGHRVTVHYGYDEKGRLTYGSGYLAGMKLGDTPLVEYTRDRLHRETLRRFGRYELTTA
ncbi:RHS repeat protein, partial [Escherichia coli]